MATLISEPEPDQKTHLMTCKAFCQGRDWPTPASIRYYIFFNKYGFADKCVKRVGRKVLIDAVGFESWLKEQAR